MVKLPGKDASFSLSLDSDGIDFLTTFFTGLNALGDDVPDLEDDADCGDNCKGRDGQETTYVDLELRLRSGPRKGPKMTTIKAIRVNFELKDGNTNPVIKTFMVNGREEPKSVRAGDEVKLKVKLEDDSFQEYVEGGTGVKLTEKPTMTWYASAGEFSKGVTVGDRRETTLTLPSSIKGKDVKVYVVVRDGRGGTAFRSATLPVKK